MNNTGVIKKIIFACQSIVPDKTIIKLRYRFSFGKSLNLKEPQTFNEKMQWLKLNNRNVIYTNLVDKFEVRKYVASTIGEEHLIPLLGIWDDFNDIVFNKLPDQFVLKCTHDSGSVIICKDIASFEFAKAKKELTYALNRNYYKTPGREWPYKNVVPRIIAEQYMEDRNGELLDYKFMSFNGKVKCSFVCTGRNTDRGLHVTFYDDMWNKLPLERHYPSEDVPMPKPYKYEEMVKLTEKLSANIPFVRVDFYEINGKIYFGELTFFPGSGYENFNPDNWDKLFGDWIDISNI
ncbi:MAG: ATP-grasp fold amidoligase family protein [Eubacteriales bacterium]